MRDAPKVELRCQNRSHQILQKVLIHIDSRAVTLIAGIR